MKNTCGTVYTDPTTDHLYQLFQKERSALYVVVDNGIVYGCCGIYPTENLPKNCAELVKFYISEEGRGKGYGRLLMEKSFNRAKEFGYTSIYLESLPEFGKAVSIYEKLGFTKLEKPKGKSGHSGCSIWMIKEI